MVALLAVMSVSTEGVIRLSKSLTEMLGVKSGDKLVVMEENDKIVIQFQRHDKVFFCFKGEIDMLASL